MDIVQDERDTRKTEAERDAYRAGWTMRKTTRWDLGGRACAAALHAIGHRYPDADLSRCFGAFARGWIRQPVGPR
jgi:hypothetical protein